MTEHIWAAGFFDGEGAVGVNTRVRSGRVSHLLAVQLYHVRPEPLERFVRAVGYGRVRGPYKPSSKCPNCSPRHAWAVHGSSATAVMELLKPHLSIPKREQYEAAKQKAYETL